MEKSDVCDMCGRAFSEDVTCCEVAHSNDTLYMCYICYKENAHSKALSKPATNQEPIVCDICDTTFQDKAAFTKHQSFGGCCREKSFDKESETRQGDSPKGGLIDEYTRQENDRAFFRILQEHTKGDHFMCDICSETFAYSNQIYHHRLTHFIKKSPTSDSNSLTPIGSETTGREKSTRSQKCACDICHKKFVSRKGYLRHKKLHTRKKLCVCDVCDKGFNSEVVLKHHVKLHKKPFKCLNCDKVFSQRCHLVQHRKIHTDAEPLIFYKDSLKPFPCDICGRSYLDKRYLVEHQRVHTKGKSFVCFICSKAFFSKDNLEHHSMLFHLNSRKGSSKKQSHEHKQTRHAKEKMLESGIFIKSVTAKKYLMGLAKHQGQSRAGGSGKSSAHGSISKGISLKDNLKRSAELQNKMRPFTCSLCNKSYSHKRYLVEHQRVHTEGKPFVCLICNKAFFSEENLGRHSRLSLAKTHVCKASLQRQYAKGKDLKSENHCKGSPSKKELTGRAKHQRQSHAGRSRISAHDTVRKRLPSKDKLKCNAELHIKTKLFTCSLCNKSYSHKRYLVEHQRVHTEGKPFVCLICNKAFASEKNLGRHSRLLHAKTHVTKGSSENHGKGLSSKKNLTGPAKAKGQNCVEGSWKPSTPARDGKGHSSNKLEWKAELPGDKKPFACDICSKSYSKKRYLTDHVRVHTQGKAFVCSICDKAFASGDNLLRHTKLCHRSTASKVSSRKQCRNLKQTNYKQNRFACEVCDKQFTSKIELAIHEKLHISQKPFLSLRKKKRSKETPFDCNICHEAFAIKRGLQQHKQLHTDNE